MDVISSTPVHRRQCASSTAARVTTFPKVPPDFKGPAVLEENAGPFSARETNSWAIARDMEAGSAGFLLRRLPSVVHLFSVTSTKPSG